MMGAYANYTCFECQIRRPAHYMKQIEVSKKSGNSGWGVSWNPQRKKSARITAPRNYYRKSMKWVCSDSRAHGDPKYYARLEEKLAAERAERARLQKIKQQEEETTNLTRVKIDNFFVPSTVIREEFFLEQLLDQDDIKDVLSLLKVNFADVLKTTTDKTIISEIIKGGKFCLKYPLRSMRDIRFKIPPRATQTEIVYRLFLIEKIERGFLQKLLRIFTVVFYVLVPAIYLIVVIVRMFKKKTPTQIYRSEVKKISKSISKCISKTTLIDNVVAQVKFDKDLTSLPYFDSCYMDLLGSEAWEKVKHVPGINTPKGANKKKKRKNNSIKNLNQTESDILKSLYESEEFFQICMLILSWQVAGADGNETADETDFMVSNFSISDDGIKLLENLRKIDHFEEKILKLMYALYFANTPALETAINNLLAVAEADGEVSQSEIIKIYEIGKKIGLSINAIQSIVENKNYKTSRDGNLPFIDEEVYPEFEELSEDY